MKSKFETAFDVLVILSLLSAAIFSAWPLINEGMLAMSHAVSSIVKN